MRPQRSINAALVYYVVSGALALVVALGTVATLASAVLAGCQLVFEQEDFVPPPVVGPRFAEPACQQYVDVLSIVAPIALAAVLLATAFAIHRRRVSLPVVILGGLAGIAAAAFPAWLVIWMSTYYGGTLGPVEIALAGVPVTLGAGAAWALWQVHRVSVHASPAAAET